MSVLLQKAILTDAIITIQVINCKDVIEDTETVSVSTLEHHYVSQHSEIVTLYASTEQAEYGPPTPDDRCTQVLLYISTNIFL